MDDEAFGYPGRVIVTSAAHPRLVELHHCDMRVKMIFSGDTKKQCVLSPVQALEPHASKCLRVWNARCALWCLHSASLAKESLLPVSESLEKIWWCSWLLPVCWWPPRIWRRWAPPGNWRGRCRRRPPVETWLPALFVHAGHWSISGTRRNLDSSWIVRRQSGHAHCAITGPVHNEEGSWYQRDDPEAEWKKWVVRIPTVKTMEEGKLQVTQQGREVNIQQAPRELITVDSWWSLRPACRNSADVKICFHMYIEYAAVTKEYAESIKASVGASSPLQAKAPPAVPTKTEGIRTKLQVKAPPSGSAINKPTGPKLPPMEERNLTLNPPRCTFASRGTWSQRKAGTRTTGWTWRVAWRRIAGTKTCSACAEDHEVLISGAMTKIPRYNPESSMWCRLVSKVSVERSEKHCWHEWQACRMRVAGKGTGTTNGCVNSMHHTAPIPMNIASLWQSKLRDKRDHQYRWQTMSTLSKNIIEAFVVHKKVTGR